MQGFVKVLFEAEKTVGETKYFFIDDAHTQLRIGSTKDEALDASALVLQVNEISDVTRVDMTTLALTSSLMPPGTPPLTFKAATARTAESWWAHLTNQPAGVNSSQEKQLEITSSPRQHVYKPSPKQYEEMSSRKRYIEIASPKPNDEISSPKQLAYKSPRQTAYKSPKQPAAKTPNQHDDMALPILQEETSTPKPPQEEVLPPKPREEVSSPKQPVAVQETLVSVVTTETEVLVNAPFNPRTSMTSVVRFSVVIVFLALTSRFFWRWVFPVKEVIQQRSAMPVYASGPSLGFSGVLGWIVFCVWFGLSMICALLANKLRSERGKLTFRFTEDKIRLTFKDDAERGVVVDKVDYKCETLGSGVRVNDAKVLRVADVDVDTAQAVRKCISEHTQRPLSIVFQSGDQMEVDSITEAYSWRAGGVFFALSVVSFGIFKNSMFPSDPAAATKASVGYGFVMFVILIGAIGAGALYMWIHPSGAKTSLKVTIPPQLTSPVSPRASSPRSSKPLMSPKGSFIISSAGVVTVEKKGLSPRYQVKKRVAPVAKPAPVAHAWMAGRPVARPANLPPKTKNFAYPVNYSKPLASDSFIPKPLAHTDSASSFVATKPLPHTDSSSSFIAKSLPHTDSSSSFVARPLPHTDSTSSVVLSPPHKKLSVIVLDDPIFRPPTPEQLERYAGMRRQGLSEMAVKIAMAKAGVTVPPGFFEGIQGVPPSPKGLPSSPTGNRPSAISPLPPSEQLSLDPKYQRMLEMGLSKMTVGIAMKKDGVESPF